MFFFFAVMSSGVAQEKNQISSSRFVGMNSCSSSGCHGGGAAQHDECITWLKKDFHSRSFATLTTARSARMAEVLKIDSPAKNASCTVCHAPFQTVPATEQKTKLDITAGVSCESCHAPAESWLLSHTRPDFTHADRVNAGMRDLKNLYVRANSCVACHQNVSTNLLAAGHPELIFELDGQAVSEPKHWREKTNWNGAQAWLVGQAIALREMGWQLSKTPEDQNLRLKFDGLLFVLAEIPSEINLPTVNFSATNFSPENFVASMDVEVQTHADKTARRISEMNWSSDWTRKTLIALANTSIHFNTKDLHSPIQARRAERLVIGLDRLVVASDEKLRSAVNAELNELFSLVQSLPDFDPKKFADALEKFSNKLRDLR